jgi:hypothetical protein
VLGGGGLLIPIRKYSPVSLRFQPTLWFNGCNILMAPGIGQCNSQQPPNQHSSGYIIMGGFPFSGLGKSTSVRHTSTHLLQPLQSSGLITTAWDGANGLGIIYAFFFTLFTSKTTMLPIVLFESWSVGGL